jgi:hypothetical protein
MRRKAATMVLAVTCSALLCAGSLLAKPTRTLTRPGARRMILAQPIHRLSRERYSHEDGIAPIRRHEGAAERRGDHLPATRKVSTFPVRAVSRHERIARSTASATPHSRPRTLAEERALAAQTAIAAADRDTRIAMKSERYSVHARRTQAAIENADAANPAARSNTFNRQSATSESAAGSDDTPVGSTTALTNIGGVLRPAAGSMPLKSIEEEAPATPLLLSPVRLSTLYDREGRLIMPDPLYGSREILVHQNEMADRDGLNRIRDDADLLDLRRQKKLVPLPESEALHADFRLPEDRRYARPWTAAFLAVVAADFYATFHIPLQVDSAVRTIAVQQRLLRINGNAAPTSGDTASPHLTGQAVDIAKGGLSRTQIAWMRTYLQPLIDLGKIDVEEEFQQSCFHISVYRNFLSISPQHISIAAAHQPAADTIVQRPTY